MLVELANPDEIVLARPELPDAVLKLDVEEGRAEEEVNVLEAELEDVVALNGGDELVELVLKDDVVEDDVEELVPLVLKDDVVEDDVV